MEGYSISKAISEKRKRIPIKRQPVYDFLQRTLSKSDIQKQRVKNYTENVVHNFFLDRNMKRIQGLTLPGITWDFERSIRKRLATDAKFRIKLALTGCEVDYKVFCLSASKMPGSHKGCINPYFSDKLNHYVVTNVKEQVYLLNMDIFDLINDPSNHKKYNFIWLDTTSTIISASKRLDGLSEKLADESIVVLTVFKGREHFKFETNRNDYTNSIMSNYGLKLLSIKEYSDTCNMVHFIYYKTRL